MKVALALFNWFPYGGLQRDCSRIGQALAGKGAETHVICMQWEGKRPRDMKVVIPPLSALSKTGRRYRFAEFLARHRREEGYDAVMGFNRLPGLDFYFAADTCFAWKAYRERHWLYRLAPRTRQYLAFEKAVFGDGSATRIFYLSSQQQTEYLACYPGAAERMTPVPPGIDRGRMAGQDAVEVRRQFRQAHGIGEDELLVLQVGSSFGTKGVDRSLAALASLPDALLSKTKLFIVGEDKPGKYQRLANSLKIGSRVTFFAGVGDLPPFFQGADLLLHPSRKESAGMVILEGIVAGLPVLTTDTCGYAFHVEKAGAGNICASPFRQQDLNAGLAEMLASDGKKGWRDNGIRYGQSEDLYDMPDRVAERVIAAIGEKLHG